MEILRWPLVLTSTPTSSKTLTFYQTASITIFLFHSALDPNIIIHSYLHLTFSRTTGTYQILNSFQIACKHIQACDLIDYISVPRFFISSLTAASTNVGLLVSLHQSLYTEVHFLVFAYYDEDEIQIRISYHIWDFLHTDKHARVHPHCNLLDTIHRFCRCKCIESHHNPLLEYSKSLVCIVGSSELDNSRGYGSCVSLLDHLVDAVVICCFLHQLSVVLPSHLRQYDAAHHLSQQYTYSTDPYPHT